jgi:hypothetical protein
MTALVARNIRPPLDGKALRWEERSVGDRICNPDSSFDTEQREPRR